jgi:hypothetical protein
MDCIENTSPNSSSIFASHNYQQRLRREPASQLLQCYEAVALQQACLQSCSLAMAVSAGFTILAFSRHATVLYTTLTPTAEMIPLCTKNLSLNHDSHSYFEEKYTITCRLSATAVPFPLNLTYTLLFLLQLISINMPYTDSLHFKCRT